MRRFRPATGAGGLACLLLALAMSTSAAAARTACGVLPGTFIQLTNAQAAWSAAEWERLFADLRAVGTRNLVLQWIVLDDTAFFHRPNAAEPAASVLAVVSRLAAREGISIWVGLRLDPRYWDAIKQEPDGVRAYFRRRLLDLAALLDDLDAVLPVVPFAGWYITDEIDDQSWALATKRAELKQYLSRAVALVTAHRRGAEVAISGFTNSSSPPADVADFWADLVKATGIHLLLFQDGVGEGKLSLDSVARYYDRVAGAVHGVGARFGVVVELFTLQPDGRRVPGTVGRIRRQLAAAARVSSFPPVAFSVPDYMSVTAGRPAAELFASFVSGNSGCLD